MGALKFDPVERKKIPAGGHFGIGYVYLVSDGFLVKIGKSQKPKMRIEAIINSMKIEAPAIFISEAHTNFSETEKALHSIFSHSRVHGEWFDLNAGEIASHLYDISLGAKTLPRDKDQNIKYSSPQIRLHPTTKLYLDEKLGIVNKARERANKKPLTMDDIIALAIENLTIETGVAK